VTGNDATAIFALLGAADDVDAVLDVLRSIQGPFAFIYWDGRQDGNLFFGRDRLGRRSLLAQGGKQIFLLSSVADSTESSWKEVEADGVYVMNLVDLVDPAPGTLGLSSVTRHDWTPDAEEEYVRFGTGKDPAVLAFDIATCLLGHVRILTMPAGIQYRNLQHDNPFRACSLRIRITVRSGASGASSLVAFSTSPECSLPATFWGPR
jgi:asparagine synthetase B (glutamine-hydrolysing)